jgi:hypothetical protein
MGMNLYYTANIASTPCIVFREKTKHFACTLFDHYAHQHSETMI